MERQKRMGRLNYEYHTIDFTEMPSLRQKTKGFKCEDAPKMQGTHHSHELNYQEEYKMNKYDVKCPQCHKVIETSSLSAGMCNRSCSSCKIRFDVKITPTSSRTGAYQITNVRKM